MTRAEILDALTQIVSEILADDLEGDLHLTMETSFSHDLELESIELVALAEAVQARYGAHVDFVAWLSELQLDQIIELTVGDVVDYVLRASSGAPG